MSLISDEDKEKGNETENRFKEWLDKHNIPYLYLEQGTKTLSPAFKENFSGKRPDFLVLIPNVGFIFVDTKYKKINPEYKTYPIDAEETKKYSSIQRKFNLTIWYALSNEDSDYKTWLWIPISKIFESGELIRTSRISGMGFYAIPPEEFIQIAFNDSLSRLFQNLF